MNTIVHINKLNLEAVWYSALQFATCILFFHQLSTEIHACMYYYFCVCLVYITCDTIQIGNCPMISTYGCSYVDRSV